MTTITYANSYICLYVTLLSFKVFQPTKRKYNLTFNIQFCLIGIFLYTQLVNDNFTRSAIYKFITYFNYKTILRYFDILLQRGLITHSYNRGTFQYFKLTDSAISIINEIPENYNRVLYQFCNKYGVRL